MFGGKSLPAKFFLSPVFLSRDLIRPHISRLRQARSGHLLVVDLRSWVGLFAHLEWFLEISLHCERHDLIPCFMSTSPQYADPQGRANWFDHFFDNLQLSLEDRERIENGEVPICRIEGIRQLGLRENYDSQLNLGMAPELVRKYIGVKPHVVHQVTTLSESLLKNGPVLGIHYRGTDKRAEAPLVPYSYVRQSIDRFLTNNSEFERLFVSSDEQAFVDYIDREFRNTVPVFYHDDQERSRTNVAVHRSRTGDRFRKAEEAVLNCLLLARCDALIKTPSILSGWSKLFNPDLPVILLSRPYTGQLWFPDRELVREAPPDWVMETNSRPGVWRSLLERSRPARGHGRT